MQSSAKNKSSALATSTASPEEALDIFTEMTDILTICKEFAVMGYNIQQQTELVVSLGIEEAISSGKVSIAAVPHIRAFLNAMANNEFLGLAASQALDHIVAIDRYQDNNPAPISRSN